MPHSPSRPYTHLASPPDGRALVEALPFAAALIDEASTILEVNQPWWEFAEANGGDPGGYVGWNYIDVCRRSDDQAAHSLADRLAALLASHEGFIDWEYPCHSPTTHRWYRVNGTRVTTPNATFGLIVHLDTTQNHRLAETARERETQLSSILNHTPEGFLVVSPEGVIQFANPAASQLFAKSPADLIGTPLGMPIPSHSPQIIESLPSSSEPRTVEMNAVKSEWEGSPAWILHFHDITEREAAENALRENEDLLERTNRMARVGGWEVDLRTNQLQWTSVTREVLEVPQDEPAPPLEEALPRFYRGESLRTVQHNLQTSMTEGTSADFETRLYTPNNRVKWVRIQATPEIKDGKVVRLMGTFQDVTERRRLESELALWGQAFSATSEGVAILDPDCRILSVNEAYEAITGFASADLAGHPPQILFNDQSGMLAHQPIGQVLSEEGHWQGELWGKKATGEPFPLRLTINAITHETGEVHHYVAVISDLTQLKTAQDRLEYLAYHDPLTELPNRRLFEDHLDQAVAQSRRSAEAIAVLLMDLNDFKALNDGFGHEIGDSVLRELGARLTATLREGDTIARWGGDEFIVLARGLCESLDASVVADRLLAAAAEPFPVGDQRFRLSLSIGVALNEGPNTRPSDLIMQADGAMYRAKVMGKGVEYFSQEVGQAARERMYLGTELARALEMDELTVHFQPQVHLEHGSWCGLEALVRWFHPEEGWISPGRFIPVAEQGGLIVRIGDLVLDRSCQWAGKGLAEGRAFERVGVNISPQQLSSGTLPGKVEQALNDAELPACHLELELTESHLVQQESRVLDDLETLRGKGVSIALDDFGTGYSSLQYLKDLPIDRLKIDRSFVDGLPTDKSDLALVQTIMALSHSLGFATLAEGIETDEQRTALMAEGCLEGQGFLFARPMAPDAIEKATFLATNK